MSSTPPLNGVGGSIDETSDAGRRHSPASGSHSPSRRGSPVTGTPEPEGRRAGSTGSPGSESRSSSSGRSAQPRPLDSREPGGHKYSREASNSQQQPPEQRSSSLRRDATGLTSQTRRLGQVRIASDSELHRSGRSAGSSALARGDGQGSPSSKSDSPRSRLAPVLTPRARGDGQHVSFGNSGSPLARGTGGSPSQRVRPSGHEGRSGLPDPQPCSLPNCQWKMAAQQQRMRAQMYERELLLKEKELIRMGVLFRRIRNGEMQPERRNQGEARQDVRPARGSAVEQAGRSGMEAEPRKGQDSLTNEREQREHRSATDGSKAPNERPSERQPRLEKTERLAERDGGARGLTAEAHNANSEAMTRESPRSTGQGIRGARRAGMDRPRGGGPPTLAA